MTHGPPESGLDSITQSSHFTTYQLHNPRGHRVVVKDVLVIVAQTECLMGDPVGLALSVKAKGIVLALAATCRAVIAPREVLSPDLHDPHRYFSSVCS